MNLASVMSLLEDEWHDWNITPLDRYQDGRLDGALAALLMTHVITIDEFDRANEWQKARQTQEQAKK